MIRYMIMQNVLHRPLRTFITVLAVAVEVTLVIIVVGLTSGLLSESAKRIEGVGADIMVQQPQASYLMAFSGAPMPIAIGDKLAQLEYVQAVAPVLTQFNTSGIEIVYGIDKESFNAVTGGFVFHEGHDLRGLDDILVDDVYAKSKKNKARPNPATFRSRFSRGRHRRTWQGRAPLRLPLHAPGNWGFARQGFRVFYQVRSH